MKLTKELVDGMVKYINVMYSPKQVKVTNIGSTYWIEIYFDEDKYYDADSPINLIKRNLGNKIKTNQLAYKISKDLKGFFSASSFVYNNDLNIHVFFE